MADKISFYGLSGSGKSCFIFAMSQALSQGIELSDGELMTVITPDPRQMIRLYNAYDKMVNGFWPAGNDSSITYNFNVRKTLELLLDIEITDYRGGLLVSDDQDDTEEQNALFQSFNDSKVLMFMFGADQVKAAMQGDVRARFNFQHFNTLYGSFLNSAQAAREAPVLVIISKADLLSATEKAQAFAFVKDQMRMLFSRGTGLTVGITAVSLGRNLTNIGGELEGELDIRANAGNLTIPVLFALYHVMGQKIEKTVGNIDCAQSSVSALTEALDQELSRSAFIRFFNDNESAIRNRIAANRQSFNSEQELLQTLNKSMAAIRDYLLSGAEMYYNGERLTQ